MEYGKNFRPPSIAQFKSLRSNNRTSFYLAPKKVRIEERCNVFNISPNADLRIFGKRGRKQGTVILYDPVQAKNYLSISARWDRSLDLLPDKVEKIGSKVCYFFCSANSSTGFWEVCVEGTNTTIVFTPPTLNIICPRPFAIQDLIDIETTAEFINWNQIQGRDTIIFPSTGDGSLNPTISIQGLRSPYDPPILIVGEAEGDPTVFDILAINTTIREIINNYVVGRGSAVQNPDLAIPCKLRLLPITPNTATCAAPLIATWFEPIHFTAWVVGYAIQLSQGQNWVTIEESADPIRFVLEPNNRYRILTIFNVLGVRKQVSVSCIFSANSAGVELVRATDKVNTGSGRGNLSARHYLVSPLVLRIVPDLFIGGGVGRGNLSARHYLVSPLVLRIVPDLFIGGGVGRGNLSARHYKLDSIVAG